MEGKRLYRSKDNKVLAGVCGGLADYFGGDPALWRLGFILLLFVTGFLPFGLLYIVAWFIVPEQPDVTYRVVE